MKILLIEDHKMLAQCLKADFESQGCTIHIADSVKKAEAELKNNDYDLILMDINLSGYGKGENGWMSAKSLLRSTERRFSS